MPDPLITIGVPMPKDFEVAAYDSVYQRTEKALMGDDLRLREFRGGWNAVAHRFLSLAEHDRVFSESIRKHGDGPPHEERHSQEHDLFGFFVNGLAVLKSGCYAMWFVGSYLKPMEFPIQPEKALRLITPGRLQTALTSAFPVEPLTVTVNQLIASTEYLQWKDARNILAHRSAPPRTIFAGASGASRPATWSVDGPGILLDDQTTVQRRAWLSLSLGSLLREMDGFVNAHLP